MFGTHRFKQQAGQIDLEIEGRYFSHPGKKKDLNKDLRQ